MKSLLFILLTAVCMVPTMVAAEGTMWKGLTQAQREQLIAGKELVLDEDVPGKPWPRFTVYRLVQSPPKTVAAVFWNAELDPAYIPNCTAVSILASPKPSTQDVEYTLKMPFVLPDEIYLSRNELRNPSPETYEVNWKVLRSRYTSSCIGNLRIESGSPVDRERRGLSASG